MTLLELAQRAAQMVKDRPELTNLPVYASYNKSKRTKQFLPINFGLGSTLRVGETLMVEFSTDRKGLIQFDHNGATCPNHD